MNTSVTFIDFDGVLCDSVKECLVSSWLAYTRLSKKDKKSITLSAKKTFYRYRPLIRTGADYVLLQRAMDEGVSLSSQRDFDDYQNALGEKVMGEYREAFYNARSKLLENHRKYWVSLNPLFEEFPPLLKKIAGSYRYIIISTKKSSFIKEILNANSIEWPLDRIVDSEKKRKLSIVENYLNQLSADKAFFVDDQIDHLKGNNDPRIEPLLADWGYVKPEWLKQDEVKIISKEKMEILLSNTM
jgi:phosphoglycolate phosphatase-like HAD superfamily hydrolase